MKPRYSFIVPCHNEERHLFVTLTSIKEQNSSTASYEIIVVDNGSSDDSRKIAAILADKVLSCPKAYVGEVRNRGAKEARGDYLVFIDADCTIDPDWLVRADHLTTNSTTSVWGGGALLPPNAKWIERYWLLENNGAITLPKALIGASILIPKHIFESVGGFNEEVTSGEDSELTNTIRKAGYEVSITDVINVTHHGNAKSAKAFIKRQIWHSENYTKDLENSLNDPVFWLVLTYVSLSALSIFSLVYSGIYSTILLTQIPPIVLTFKRIKRSPIKTLSIALIFNCLILDNLYLIGRSLGLIKGALQRKIL